MKKYIILFVAAILGSSCSNLLEQDPTNAATPEDLQKVDLDLVVAPMLSAAMLRLHSTGAGVEFTGYKNLNLCLDLCGNDMVLNVGGGGGWFRSLYSMTAYRGATDSNAYYQWSVYYKYAWAANQVMEFIDFEKVSDVKKAEFLSAQALTLRAFSYYHLICLYQDAYLFGGKDKSGVPLYTKTTDKPKGRGTAAEVYAKIVSDCKQAIQYFESSKMVPDSKEDISVYVAYMVLARTALTMGDYSTAASAADKVISGFTLMTQAQAASNGFQKLGGPETIWGYKWTQNTTIQNNSFSSNMSTNATGYGGASEGYKMIDERLYNQIPAGDWRKGLFYAVPTDIEYDNGTSVTVNTVPMYANSKFNAPSYNQDEVFMRVSEAYFIKAEAQASNASPDFPGAQQTLFNILSTRNPSYVKSSSTGDALIKEIQLNKRIEMWGEGLEFYDNKRINKGVDRSNSTNQTSKNVVPPGKDFTLRLPKTQEIELNPGISEEDNNPL